MSQTPSPAVGQVSADGQFRWDGGQWVPIPRGEREPTPWTRPMQLATAALFTVQAIYGVVSTLLFVNHDSILKAIKAQGNIPAGTDLDTIANVTVGITFGVAIVISVLALVAALGSYLGWRWMFWVALVLFGLGTIGALTNLQYFGNPARSPLPIGAIIVTELFSLVGVALFVWLLVGAIKYGPWAMKRPGT